MFVILPTFAHISMSTHYTDIKHWLFHLHHIESQPSCYSDSFSSKWIQTSMQPFVGIRIRWNWIRVASEIEFYTFFFTHQWINGILFFPIDFGFAMQFRTLFLELSSSSSRCHEMKTKLFYIHKMTLSTLRNVRLLYYQWNNVIWNFLLIWRLLDCRKLLKVTKVFYV